MPRVGDHRAAAESSRGIRAAAGFISRDSYRGIEIHRASGTRFDKRRFAGRAANYVSYFLSACWAGLRLDRPTMVVALTDPPIIGLAASSLGRASERLS